jgi:hypothetical protein
MNNDPLIGTVSPEKIWTSSTRYICLVLGVYVAIFLLLYALNIWTGAMDTPGFLGSFGLALLLFSPYTFIRWRNRRLYWEGYSIVWEKQTVTCRQKNRRDIVLYHHDVNSVQVAPKGDLLIIGSDAADFFTIPHAIEGYDQLKTLLEEMVEFQPPPNRHWVTLGKVLGGAAYGSVFVTLICLHDARSMFWGALVAIILQILNLIYAVLSRHLNRNGRTVRILFAVCTVPILIILMTFRHG